MRKLIVKKGKSYVRKTVLVLKSDYELLEKNYINQGPFLTNILTKNIKKDINNENN